MQILVALLLIAVTAAVIYAILKINPTKNRPAPRPLSPADAAPYEPRLPDSAPALHWSDHGRFMVEVVNESRYQATLHELAGDHGDQAAATPYVATLMPDDDNAYENHSVAVFIAGRMAGYLSQKASIKFRELLRKHEASGQLSTCDAQVRGGTLWQGKRLQYVVVLDVEPLEK